MVVLKVAYKANYIIIGNLHSLLEFSDLSKVLCSDN